MWAILVQSISLWAFCWVGRTSMCGEQTRAEGHPAGRLCFGVHGDPQLWVHGAGDLQPALSQLQQVWVLIHTTHSVVFDICNPFVSLWNFLVVSHLRLVHIRVSLKTQNVSDKAPTGGYAVSICGGPPKFVSEFFFPQFLTGRVAHLCFGLYSREKGTKKPKNWNLSKLAW